jgi:hypothetical protein
MTRCNPYGYATDAGPKHLMGGMYGPAYAGKQVTERDGIHGPAVCTLPADRRVRMICDRGHAGPVMDICGAHAIEIMARMAQCCTRCVWPSQARGLNEAMDWLMAEMADARAKGDGVRYGKLEAQLNDYARSMDELVARGIIAKVPLKLVEVS